MTHLHLHLGSTVKSPGVKIPNPMKWQLHVIHIHTSWLLHVPAYPPMA